MYESEYEVLKRNLDRLGKIEESCEKSIEKHFASKEIAMYQAAKEFVEAYDARAQAKSNSYMTNEGLKVLDRVAEREDEDDDE